MNDLSSQLQALAVSLGYAVTLGIAVVILFCAAAALSLLLRWRTPKSTHRWPK